MSEDTQKSDDQVTETKTVADNAANRALLAEKKALAEKVAAYEAAAEAAQTEADKKAGDFAKLEQKLKDAHQKELAARDAVIAERDTALRTAIIDNAIQSELTRLGVLPDLADAAFLLLKSKSEFKDGAASIDGKPVTEAVSEWGTSKQAAAFIRADANAGSGASGSTAKGTAMTAETWNYTKWSETLATNPAEAKAMAMACGKTELANSII